jgi:hypothetical protein
MKLPAVAIAAAFVCGIVAGLYPPIAHRVIAPAFLAGVFAVVGCLIAAGTLFVRLDGLGPGAAAAMSTWVFLGVGSAGIAQQPLRPITS